MDPYLIEEADTLPRNELLIRMDLLCRWLVNSYHALNLQAVFVPPFNHHALPQDLKPLYLHYLQEAHSFVTQISPGTVCPVLLHPDLLGREGRRIKGTLLAPSRDQVSYLVTRSPGWLPRHLGNNTPVPRTAFLSIKTIVPNDN